LIFHLNSSVPTRRRATSVRPTNGPIFHTCNGFRLAARIYPRIRGYSGNEVVSRCSERVVLLWYWYHRLGLAGSAHDLGRAAAVGRCKDDFRNRLCGSARPQMNSDPCPEVVCGLLRHD
jgi:hypothetical protein